MTVLDSILGPRVPPEELRRSGFRYRLPTVLLWLARMLLLVSIFVPYWKMTLEAPQYPDDLHVQAYVNRLIGDVKEIDGLNHYIGMRPLEEAAQLERSLSIAAIISLMLLVEGAVYVHSRWAALLCLPAVLFPFFFLADLYYWLSSFGQNLDPAAPLSSAIEPFTPPVLGVGVVGQFRTVAAPGPGLILAWIAAGTVLVGLFFHRRAYKPLHDSRRGGAPSAGGPASAAAVLALAVLAPAAAGGELDIAAAIRTAPAGDEVRVPAGIYRGPIVIDRPLALVADGQAVLDGGGSGDVVQIVAPDVTVRGFVIRGTGDSLDRENAGITVTAPRAVMEGNHIEDALFGIYLKGAADSVIRGNTILGKDLPVQRRGDGIRIWQSDRTLIEDNTVRDSRDAVMWFSDGVVLRRNTVTGGRYGLHFMYSDDNVLEENRLEGNSVGAFLMYSRNLVLRRNVFAYNRGPSGYGVGLKDMDGAVVEENLFIGNRVGLRLDNSPSSMRVHQHFAGNVLAYNDIGLGFLPSVKRNSFHDNAFLDNLEQVAVLGRGEFSGNDFTVDGRGNYWSDYNGYDADGDGIGDLPYRSDSLFENLMDREPRLRLFLFSPAQQAIDLAARAFPIVKPEPKLADTAPLMRPVTVDLGRASRPGRAPMLLLAAALLGGAGAVLLAGRWPETTGRRATRHTPAAETRS